MKQRAFISLPKVKHKEHSATVPSLEKMQDCRSSPARGSWNSHYPEAEMQVVIMVTFHISWSDKSPGFIFHSGGWEKKDTDTQHTNMLPNQNRCSVIAEELRWHSAVDATGGSRNAVDLEWNQWLWNVTEDNKGLTWKEKIWREKWVKKNSWKQCRHNIKAMSLCGRERHIVLKRLTSKREEVYIKHIWHNNTHSVE